MRSAAVVALLGLTLLGACEKPQPANARARQRVTSERIGGGVSFNVAWNGPEYRIVQRRAARASGSCPPGCRCRISRAA